MMLNHLLDSSQLYPVSLGSSENLGLTLQSHDTYLGINAIEMSDIYFQVKVDYDN